MSPRAVTANSTTLMVVGYANDPAYFEQHIAELDEFTGRIALQPAGAVVPPPAPPDGGAAP